MNNPYDTYKQQSVKTMTAAEMLIMLYDGALKELNLGLVAFEKDDYAEINRALQKAQRIINYLNSSLDMNYEIANNLESLYDYFNSVIINANISKKPDGLSDIIEMITEIRNAYAQAAKTIKIEEAARV